MTRRSLAVTLASFLLNCAAPVLDYKMFAGADDSQLEGAYLGAFILGSPLAFATLSIEAVLFATLWPRGARRTPMFSAAAAAAALPALAIISWPQIGMFFPMFTLGLGFGTAGWVGGLAGKTALLCGLTYAAAALFARQPARKLRLGILLLPFALGAAFTAFYLGPAIGPQPFHGAWASLAEHHPVPREIVRSDTSTGAEQGLHPCAVAPGIFMTIFATNTSEPKVVSRPNDGGARVFQALPAPEASLGSTCAIAADWHGDVYVVDTTHGRILAFHDDGYGHSRFVGTIAGNASLLVRPRYVRLNAQRHIFVLDDDKVLEFQQGAIGNERPVRILELSPKELAGCTGFGVDRRATLFLKDCGDQSKKKPYIAVYRPVGKSFELNGVIAGAHTLLSATEPIAVTQNGDVIALTDAHDVIMYERGRLGDAQPVVVTEGPLDVEDPTDLAIAEGPTIYIVDRKRDSLVEFRSSRNVLTEVGD